MINKIECLNAILAYHRIIINIVSMKDDDDEGSYK